MRASNVNSIKRGSTPSAPKNPTPVTIARKIVDATSHLQSLKKSPNVGIAQHQLRQQPQKEENIFFSQAKANSNIYEGYAQKLPHNPSSMFTNNPTGSLGGSGLFTSKQQPSTIPQMSMAYQPFGVQENDKAYPSPQTIYSKQKSQEMRREEIMGTEVYRDLQNRFDRMQHLYEEEKRNNRELEEKLKKKEALLREMNSNNQRNMAEVGLSRKKIQDLLKKVRRLEEHIKNLQEQEENHDQNNEQMMAMMYALRLHQAEEQQLQYAIQQSAEEVESDPNNINIEGMTYEELLELEEKNGKVSKGLAQEVIDELDVVEFNEEIKQSQERCTICINDFEIGEELKCLPCNHLYHMECVEHWLHREKHCPLCKTEIPTQQH